MRPAAAICRELTADRRTDGELLTAFVAGPSEEAFAELVRRYGPLVWGTCRRLLPDPSDAEDAFQASFLVLVRRARGLIHSTTVAAWLYRVAVLTARSVRRKNARRLARQTTLPDHVPDTSPPPDPHLKADLDAALLALPARYRDPILLCHMQGFSRREAAERLGCPEGTLSAWLNRGLAKLRDRLRGLDPTKVLTIATVSVPAALTATTARAAVATAIAAAGVPPAITVLVKGVLHMFWVKKATAATFALCAVFAMGVGVGLGTRTEHTGAAAQDNPTKPTPAKQKETQNLADEAKALATDYEALLQHDSKVRDALNQLTESLKKGETDPAKLKLTVETLTKLQKEVEVNAEKMKATKAKLDQLKAAGMPPAPLVLDPADAAKIDRQLNELKAQLDVLTAERKKLADLTTDFERKAKDIDAKTKVVLEAAQRLQAMRAELGKQSGHATKPGAYLEIFVTGKDALWPCRVKEFGPDGKLIGSVIAEDLAILGPLLSRAAKDPNGPKEVRIATQLDTPTERLSAVVEACKQAGHQKGTVTTAVPAAGLDLFSGKQQNIWGATFQNKADFEEFLKKLNKAPKP